MKTKNLTFLAASLTLTALIVIGSFTVSRSVTAQENASTRNLTAQAKTINFSKNEKKVNRDIPDKVAYELFLRTVGEYNAKGLVERSGLGEKEVEKIVAEAKSLNDILTSNDESARRIKQSKDNLLSSEIRIEVNKIRAKSEEAVDRTVSRYLSTGFTVENANKLKDFINSEVKDNITVVIKPKIAEGEVSFIKTSARSSLQTDGSLYLYSAAWQSGTDVFGAGTLSEQYQSDSSYSVTTTVSSSYGRSNTTTSDWSYATLSQNTGLSIGIDDGTYTIQSSFKVAEGYYDEYGNFNGTGSSDIGNSYASVIVDPTINVESISPPLLELRGNAEGEVTASVSVTRDVPLNTTVVVEIYETMGAAFTYSIAPESGTKSFTVSQPGRVVPVDFVIKITTNNSPGTGTEAKNKIRIQSVTPPQGNSTPIPVAGSNQPELRIKYTGPTTQGGGGSGGNTGSQCYYNGGGGGIYNCQPGYSNGWGPTGTGVGGYCCQYSSPLLLDIDGNGYAMTDYYEGVPFDVAGKGYATQTSWTAANSDDAWIVLDRNENNRIDNGTEMFGDASEQDAAQNPRNGFASLAIFDTAARGGNADGKITRRDAVFRKLRLWQDRNHNGISEPEELSRLPALDVVAVFLDYRESKRTDQYGNRFKFRAKVRDRNDARVGRWAWDVFLLIAPPNGSNASACALRY